MRKTRRRVYPVLCVFLFLMLFSSCSREPEEELSSSGKGRYVADEIAIEDMGFYRILSMAETIAGNLRCITENGILESADDGHSWEKVESLPEELYNGAQYMIQSAALDAQDNMFFVSEEFYPEAVYYYKKSGGDLQEIAIELPELIIEFEDEDWTPVNTLEKVQFVDEERLLGYNGKSELYLIDLSSGQVLQSFGLRNEFSGMDGYTVSGDLLIYKLQDKPLCIFDLKREIEIETEAVLQEYFAQAESNGIYSGLSHMMQPVADGSGFYFCNSSGIYRYLFGASQIELIMNGSNTLLDNPEYWFEWMHVRSDSSFFFFCHDGEMTQQLLHYYYSAEAATMPDKELTIYTLYESGTIKQAAADFQKLNSQYYINLETGLPYDSELSTEEAVKQLNTRILAGDGPDIVLMNGDFPIESYIDNEMFVDISQVVEEKEHEGSYFSNIIRAFETDSGIMAVPVRFNMPVISAEPQVLKQINDFADMADYLEAVNSEYMVLAPAESGLPYDEPASYFLYGYQQFFSAQGELDADALGEFMENLRRAVGTDTGEYEYYWEQYIPSVNDNEIYILLDMQPLSKGVIKSYSTLIEMISINGEIGWEYKPFYENTFVPVDTVAISARSNSVEEAEVFIEYLLSEEFQQKDSSYDSGLPVNITALDASFKADSKGSGARSEMKLEDENGVELKAGFDYHKLTKDEYELFIKQCNNLDTPLVWNYTVADIMMDHIYDFLNEKKTKEEAVAEIKSGLQLYVEELK